MGINKDKLDIRNNAIQGINKDAQDIIDNATTVINDISERRKKSKSYTPEEILSSTKSEYVNKFRRIERLTSKLSGFYTADSFIQSASACKSSETWYKRKAAIFYWVSAEIKKNLNLLENVDNIDSEAILKKVRRDTDILNILETTPNPTLKILKDEEDQKLRFFKKSGKTSKKYLLRDLPKNWRQRIFELNFRGDDEARFLTLAISGCRPEELRRGVTWKLNKKGLTARILGAKRKKFSGQKFRFLSFSPHQSPLHEKLAKIVGENGGELLVNVEVPKTLSNTLTRVGKKLFPKLKESLTAYVFRHQLASDIKFDIAQTGSKLTLQDLAAALGHSTDEMQQQYGHVKQSKSGGSGLVRVRAERAVRNKIKPYPIKRVSAKSAP